MSNEHPPPGEFAPPGPVIEPEPERKTGGLSVDEWLEESRRRPPDAVGPYQAPQLGGPTRPRASQTMAGWALGLSLAFCLPFAFVVGAGLAIAVLVKGRDGRNHGRGKAIAALVISGLLLLGNLAYVVYIVLVGIDEAERDASGNVVEGGSVSLEQIRIGDCFSEPNLDEVPEADEGASTVLDVVPCDEPHQAEAFLQIPLSGNDYPGTGDIRQQAETCFTIAFERFVGLAYERSKLEVLYYFPSKRSWSLGHREILCAVVEQDLSDRTESAEDSRR